MKESVVEKYLRERVEGLGGRCFKLVDQPGMPDRLVVLQGLHLVETKRPKGGRLSLVQKALHAEMITLGATPIVLRNHQEIDLWIAQTFTRTSSRRSPRSSLATA